MVQYCKEFHPIIECSIYLENYVRKGNHQELLHSWTLQEAEPFMIEALQLLDQIMMEMGTVLDEQFSHLRYLFAMYKKSGSGAFLEFLYLYMDISYTSADAQIDYLKTKWEEDHYCFARSLLADDMEETDAMMLQVQEIQKYFDQLECEDGLKWKFWRTSEELDHILEDVRRLMKELDPIYRKYDKEMAHFYKIFEEAVGKDYPQGDVYHHMITMLGSDFQAGQEDVIILPSLANAVSMAFIDRHQNAIYIVWGILALDSMKYRRERISTERICSGLKLLSDRSKFDILRFVSHQPYYGAQIAKELKLTTPTISYHMQALISANFICFEKDNNRLYYKMNTEYLTEFLDAVKERLLSNS